MSVACRECSPRSRRFPKTYSLTDGIDLGDVTTTGDLEADVDLGELVDTEEKDGLVELGPEDLGGVELKGNTVDLDEALALHTAGDRYICRKTAPVSNCRSLKWPEIPKSNISTYPWRSSSCRKPGPLA